MKETRARRARKRSDRSGNTAIRAGAVSAFTALALVAALTPFQASAAPDAPAAPKTKWGHGTTQPLPPAPHGKTKAPPNLPRTGGAQSRGAITTLAGPDWDAGDVPWHNYQGYRLNDSTVARVDVSTGNLMIASTDLDIAGVGQRLQASRTANSFWTGSKGSLGLQLFNYQRGLTETATAVDIQGESGNTMSFPKKTGGGFDPAKGYKADLTKDGAGVYTLTWRKDGKKETFTAADGLTSITERNGGKITVVRTGTDTVRATETRSGRWVELHPAGSGPDIGDGPQWKNLAVVDNAGRTATYRLVRNIDPNGWQWVVGKVDDVNGETVRYAYDNDERVTQITTAMGHITRFTYDTSSRVTSVTQITDLPTGQEAVTLYAYSAAHGVAGTTTVTDPRLNATVFAVQADGHVDRVTDAQGHKRDTTYDINGNVQTAVDAMGTGSNPGNVTTYGWDAAGNLTSTQMPTGATASLTGYQTYAGAQLPASLTDPNGDKTSYSYDTSGNTLGVSDATTGGSGAQLTYTYNPASPTCGGFKGQRCTSKDANLNTTDFTYNTTGDLTNVAAPAPLGDTVYTYDNLGRTSTAKDGRNITTTYTYDNHDRVKTVATPGKYVAYDYDKDGNQTKRTDAAGTVKVEYDDLGREWRRTLVGGDQTTLHYDAAGNVIRYDDPMGRVLYDYDTLNNLTKVTDPLGGETTFAYNANGARTSTTYPGGVVQAVDLDTSGRPKQVKATKGTTSLSELNYTYAYGASNTDGSKFRTRTDGAGVKNTYTYDTLGRLTNARETDSANTQLAAWLYCYDKAGNLTATSTTTTACGSAGT
ncbi:RHS repeat protein, partial [Streptomyces sp. SID3343]|uniref:RHS repeat protein n=1 Tax=Streptomyces sp. SID3343 TaxID=2690260 RepID=UPI00136A8909